MSKKYKVKITYNSNGTVRRRINLVTSFDKDEEGASTLMSKVKKIQEKDSFLQDKHITIYYMYENERTDIYSDEEFLIFIELKGDDAKVYEVHAEFETRVIQEVKPMPCQTSNDSKTTTVQTMEGGKVEEKKTSKFKSFLNRFLPHQSRLNEDDFKQKKPKKQILGSHAGFSSVSGPTKNKLTETDISEWHYSEIIDWLRTKKELGVEVDNAITKLEQMRQEGLISRSVMIFRQVDKMVMRGEIKFPEDLERDIFVDELRYLKSGNRFNSNLYVIIRKLIRHPHYQVIARDIQDLHDVIRKTSDREWLINHFIHQLVERTASGRYEIKNSIDKLKVHFVVTETMDNPTTALNKIFKKGLGKFQKFGIYHSALSVGPFFVTWNDLSLSYPKDYDSRKARMFLELGQIPLDESVTNVKNLVAELAGKVADVMMRWNTTFTYTKLGIKELNQKMVKKTKCVYGGNCQNFVVDILKDLEQYIQFSDMELKDIFLSQDKSKSASNKNELFKWWMGQLRNSGSISWKFKATKVFAAKFDIEPRVYDFTSHKQFDTFCFMLLENAKEKKLQDTKLGFAFRLLKGIDRGFWLRYQRLQLDEIPNEEKLAEVEPLKKMGVVHGKQQMVECCFFNNPNFTQSFWEVD